VGPGPFLKGAVTRQHAEGWRPLLWQHRPGQGGNTVSQLWTPPSGLLKPDLPLPASLPRQMWDLGLSVIRHNPAAPVRTTGLESWQALPGLAEGSCSSLLPWLPVCFPSHLGLALTCYMPPLRLSLELSPCLSPSCPHAPSLSHSRKPTFTLPGQCPLDFPGLCLCQPPFLDTENS
jgi:hypothetical protein